MSNSEFSNEFDVLYNNITSNAAPGLNEYEKSVFLTKALDEIVKSYFDPRLNKPQEGFDGNERRQVDFSMIIDTFTANAFTAAMFDSRPNSKSTTIPVNIMMFINEFVDVVRDGQPVRLSVVPINYTEYSRLMSKPFKRPLKFQAWRLLSSNSADNPLSPYGKIFDIIVGPIDTIIKYVCRYIRRPKAIILSNLDGVTIDGKSTKQECELDPILHHEILLRAVELAKAAYTGDLTSQLTLGVNSLTNVGMVTSNNR